MTALVAGDESSAITTPTGYRGEFTIAYRSTKVGHRFAAGPLRKHMKYYNDCTNTVFSTRFEAKQAKDAKDAKFWRSSSCRYEMVNDLCGVMAAKSR